MLEKKWEYNETAHWPFVDFRKAYDSVTREVLYSILIDFGVPMKLVRLIKMCLTLQCRIPYLTREGFKSHAAVLRI
jgi:hypothetical protein